MQSEVGAPGGEKVQEINLVWKSDLSGDLGSLFLSFNESIKNLYWIPCLIIYDFGA